MSTIVDRINSVISLGANTGFVTGDARFGSIKHILLTNGAEPTNDDLLDSESLKTWLESKLTLSRTDAEKIFVFSGFHEFEDNTGDPSTATLADGYEEVLNDPIPKYTGKHTADIGQTQSMAAFNGFTGYAFFVDSKGAFYYVGKTNGGGKGFDVTNLYASYPRPGGTAAINTGTVKISFDIEQFKSNIGRVKIDFNPKDLSTLYDVQLTEFAAASGYAFKIGARTVYTGRNIYDTYKDSLAVVGAWKITRLDDGTTVTVASVAKDDALKAWTVTAGSSPTIATGVKLKIELVDPVALAALTLAVEGIESVAVKVVKP
jgi:hypothetical protein